MIETDLLVLLLSAHISENLAIILYGHSKPALAGSLGYTQNRRTEDMS